MREKIIAQDKEHLKQLIRDEIKHYGNDCDLNHIDISKLESLSQVFCFSQFNGDVSKWDTSNITDMSGMFHQSSFKGDISAWNVSQVTDMSMMFFDSQFNSDISKWNTSQVKTMSEMFVCSKFNQDISTWDVSKVEDMSYMFSLTPFNYDLSSWEPYSLKNPKKDDIFNQCNAPRPYWEKCITNEEIIKAIESYKLMNQLNNDLDVNGIIKPRVKV